MQKLNQTLEKISNVIFAVQKWALIIAVVVVTAVNFINVVMRYIFKSSISCCENLSLALFMFMILIGGNIAVKSDSEIKIEVIRFKDKRKGNLFKLISDVCSIVALLCLLIGSCNLVAHTAQFNQAVASLPITYLQLYSLLIIGSVLMLFDHIIVFLKRVEELLTNERGEEAAKK